MTTSMLFTKISSLTPELKEEVNDFIEFLKLKNSKKPLKQREFGSLKGMFVIRENFDEPLEDFNEYM
jgi:hypothetical protein